MKKPRIGRPKIGVIIFPGTNCDTDTIHSLERASHAHPLHETAQVQSDSDQSATVQRNAIEVVPLWHEDYKRLPQMDAIILPGGFSYSDNLRAGAIACFSPIMDAIQNYAEKKKGLILGICNGFQVLTESMLLPGALTYNSHTRFISRNQKISISTKDSPFLHLYGKSTNINLPIAHISGRYEIDKQGYNNLVKENCILLRYAPGTNPNGSVDDIAGICDKTRRIFGLMPHPERNTRPGFLPNAHGETIFLSMIDTIIKGYTQ